MRSGGCALSAAALLSFVAGGAGAPLTAQGQSPCRDHDLLRQARSARGLPVQHVSMPTRTRLEFDYRASWAESTVGELVLEFVSAGRYSRTEYRPWQRITHERVVLDADSYERSVGAGPPGRPAVSAASEANHRARALREWLVYLNAIPGWVEIACDVSSDVQAAILVLSGQAIDARFRFDPNTHLLMDASFQGWNVDGRGRRAALARVEIESYRRVDGVWFPESVRQTLPPPSGASTMSTLVTRLREVTVR